MLARGPSRQIFVGISALWMRRFHSLGGFNRPTNRNPATGLKHLGLLHHGGQRSHQLWSTAEIGQLTNRDAVRAWSGSADSARF